MRADGACPTCGKVLASPPIPHEPDDQPGPEADSPKVVTGSTVDVRELAGESGRAPWHFKVLVGLVVIYLGWRVLQLATWFF